MKCSECKTENPESRKFCRECGAKLVLKCSQCGCENMPGDMVKFYNQPPQLGIRASCGFHTCPPAFGKIISMLKPRLAVMFHWFDEEGTRYNQYDGVRQTYDGPLSMATDMMVWNVRRDEIIERMAVSQDNAWDVPDPDFPSQYTDFILKGRFDTTEAEKQTRDAYNKKYGLNE